MIKFGRANYIGHSRILGIGGYRPRRVMTNTEICQVIESTEEWIQTRCGIRERRFAGEDETLLMMATAAGRQAVDVAGVDPSAVDLVLLSSMSNLMQTPPLAGRVAHELGASAAAGIDISAACAGFCHALAIASDAVQVGSAELVLVIGAERMTDIVEATDRSIAFMFADGAGAMLVGGADRPGIGPVVRRTNGTFDSALHMTAGWADGGDRPWMRMDGKRVFRWAMDEVAPAAAMALNAAEVAPADLGAFIPHQANLRMIELMAERLGLTGRTAVATDVVHAGNTSAASIPLAMQSLLDTGAAHSGDTALLVGFGAGLNFAAQTVELP